MQDLQPGDVIVVYSISRLARSLRVTLELLNRFDQKKVGFASATENFDTQTPMGRTMFHMIAVFAELEIENTKERSMQGRSEAARQGK